MEGGIYILAKGFSALISRPLLATKSTFTAPHNLVHGEDKIENIYSTLGVKKINS